MVKATRKRSKTLNQAAAMIAEPQMMKFRGCIEMEMRALDGKLMDRREYHNVICVTGRRWALSRLATNDANTIGFIAVGTVTTAPVSTDTALGNENVRTTGAYSSNNITSTPPNVAWTCQFATNQGNTTLAEAGLFNSSSGGTIFSHVTFATINKTNTNTLSITYTITA